MASYLGAIISVIFLSLVVVNVVERCSETKYYSSVEGFSKDEAYKNDIEKYMKDGKISEYEMDKLFDKFREMEDKERLAKKDSLKNLIKSRLR